MVIFFNKDFFIIFYFSLLFFFSSTRFFCFLFSSFFLLHTFPLPLSSLFFSFVLRHFRLHFTFFFSFLLFVYSTGALFTFLFSFFFSSLLFIYSRAFKKLSLSCLFLVFLLHTSVQPPLFYFLFHLKNIPATSHLLHIREERERERGERLGQIIHHPTASGDRGRRKDKAGGDQRSPCSTTTSTAPSSLILLPTTRLSQIGLFKFFFFFFFFIFACSDSTLFLELDFTFIVMV